MDYSLYDCQLTKDNPKDKLGKVTNQKPKIFKDMITDLTGPGSILKETESEAVVKKYWKTIANYVSEGFGYHDEHISVNLEISGVFEDENDRFDPSRHSINVSIVPGTALKEATENIKPQYVDPNTELPKIKTVYDWGSDTTNESLTPGGTLEIEGKSLKVYDEMEGQGVFFISKADSTETRVALFRKNEPKNLSLKVPQLEAGEYRIEIRNTVRRGKTLRTGMSPIIFTVK